MREKGQKFHCKECKTSYSFKGSFFTHVREVHANKKIEPVIVFDASKALKIQKKYSKPKKLNENLKSERNLNAFPKPMKGMWIVKLERLQF